MLATSDARTDGITDVSFIPDLTGDGRPEIIFGLAHVHGAFDSMDFDPGDDAISSADTTLALQVDLRQGQTAVTEGTGAPRIWYVATSKALSRNEYPDRVTRHVLDLKRINGAEPPGVRVTDEEQHRRQGERADPAHRQRPAPCLHVCKDRMIQHF